MSPPPPATRTVIRAFLATPPKVAGATLRPVTIAHVLCFEDFRDAAPAASAKMQPEEVAALWEILQQSGEECLSADGQRRWRKPRTTRLFAATQDEIRALLGWYNAAFDTAISTAIKSDFPQNCGLGWIANLIHAYASEFARPPYQVLTQTPLSQVFLMVNAIHRANGGKFAGLDYVQRDLGLAVDTAEQDAIRAEQAAALATAASHPPTPPQ